MQRVSALVWREPGVVQIGADDGLVAPVVYRDLPAAVVRALDELGRTGAFLGPFLAPADLAVLRTVVAELRAAGHLDEPRPAAPYALFALDAHPLTASVVRLLLDVRVPVVLDSVPAASCTAGQLADLKYDVARRGVRRGGQPTIALLTCGYVPDPARIAPLLRTDTPFVLAVVRDRSVEISPVIVPGHTACPLCRYRGASAPELLVASQLRVRRPPAVPAAALAVAAAFAVHAITRWGEAPGLVSSVSAVVETGTCRVVSGSWARDPECRCATPAA